MLRGLLKALVEYQIAQDKARLCNVCQKRNDRDVEISTQGLQNSFYKYL